MTMGRNWDVLGRFLRGACKFGIWLSPRSGKDSIALKGQTWVDNYDSFGIAKPGRTAAYLAVFPCTAKQDFMSKPSIIQATHYRVSNTHNMILDAGRLPHAPRP